MAGNGQFVAANANALSKNQRMKGLAATRQTEGEAEVKFISMWIVRELLS